MKTELELHCLLLANITIVCLSRQLSFFFVYLSLTIKAELAAYCFTIVKYSPVF